MYIKVDGETITCTPEHPFYVQDNGWTAAKNLKTHDKLELQNGKSAVVDVVRREKLPNPIAVYNFEVEAFHTYFVGTGCMLVHNLCKQQTVAKEGKYSAKVSVGGENNRHAQHAHIFEKATKIASVKANGEVTAGMLDKSGRKFVNKYLLEIAEGIQQYYNMKL